MSTLAFVFAIFPLLIFVLVGNKIVCGIAQLFVYLRMETLLSFAGKLGFPFQIFYLNN